MQENVDNQNHHFNTENAILRDEKIQNTPYKPTIMHEPMSEYTVNYSSIKTEAPLFNEIQQANMYAPKGDYLPEKMITEEDNTMNIESFNNEYYGEIKRNLMF